MPTTTDKILLLVFGLIGFIVGPVFGATLLVLIGWAISSIFSGIPIGTGEFAAIGAIISFAMQNYKTFTQKLSWNPLTGAYEWESI